jgi:hypothetical protein
MLGFGEQDEGGSEECAKVDTVPGGSYASILRLNLRWGSTKDTKGTKGRLTPSCSSWIVICG